MFADYKCSYYAFNNSVFGICQAMHKKFDTMLNEKGLDRNADAQLIFTAMAIWVAEWRLEKIEEELPKAAKEGSRHKKELEVIKRMYQGQRDGLMVELEK